MTGENIYMSLITKVKECRMCRKDASSKWAKKKKKRGLPVFGSKMDEFETGL